jgi:hypothetical protein
MSTVPVEIPKKKPKKKETKKDHAIKKKSHSLDPNIYLVNPLRLTYATVSG